MKVRERVMTMGLFSAALAMGIMCKGMMLAMSMMSSAMMMN